MTKQLANKKEKKRFAKQFPDVEWVSHLQEEIKE